MRSSVVNRVGRAARRSLQPLRPGGRQFAIRAQFAPLQRMCLATDATTDRAGASRTSSEPSGGPSMESYKDRICEAALAQVGKHGWSREAVAAAVLENGWSVSMTGMVTPNDLVSYWMDRWNDQLEEFVRNNPHGNVVYNGFRFRLEKVLPVVQAGRWHEGMALGLKTPSTTRAQLHRIVELVSNAGSQTGSGVSIHQQAALGGIYASAELHLLTDSSPGYADTWKFLEDRVRDYETGTGRVITGIVGEVPLAATSAVAYSLMEGVASLVTPFKESPWSSTSTKNNTMTGTSPDDYAQR